MLVIWVGKSGEKTVSTVQPAELASCHGRRLTANARLSRGSETSGHTTPLRFSDNALKRSIAYYGFVVSRMC
jgi:hypothetical protein